MKRAMKTVVVLSIALAVTVFPPASPAGQDTVQITVRGKEFQFAPSEISLPKGQRVTIVFKNDGALSHNLTIEKIRLSTKTIAAGASAAIDFTPDKMGTFKYVCTVPGHKEAGMVGTLKVID